MTQLNGINYTEMLLTDEELAVVKAMRDGADIHVGYWLKSSPDKAIEKVNEFGDVKTIFDLPNSISFGTSSDSKMKCTAYLWK